MTEAARPALAVRLCPSPARPGPSSCRGPAVPEARAELGTGPRPVSPRATPDRAFPKAAALALTIMRPSYFGPPESSVYKGLLHKSGGHPSIIASLAAMVLAIRVTAAAAAAGTTRLAHRWCLCKKWWSHRYAGSGVHARLTSWISVFTFSPSPV